MYSKALLPALGAEIFEIDLSMLLAEKDILEIRQEFFRQIRSSIPQSNFDCSATG